MILGVIELKDVVKQGIQEKFEEMRQMGIRTVMITGDNPLTAAAIAQEAGVDDYLAEATPEAKMALIVSEQEGGKLVAMTGDGTNDAPALAQADVGVAMNTGTTAAKEAGNMVDLDSNPTKLIDIVEIGKQLLITRGSLTTFSIANDIAKYFAIIPALFVATYPQLNTLNIMKLHSPQSAVLSAVIFNALVIVALIPLALRGVKFRAAGSASILRRNVLIYGVGGVSHPSCSSSSSTSSSRRCTRTNGDLLMPTNLIRSLTFSVIVLALDLRLRFRRGRRVPALLPPSGRRLHHPAGSTLIGQNWAEASCPGHPLGSCVFHGRPDDTARTQQTRKRTCPAATTHSSQTASTGSPRRQPWPAFESAPREHRGAHRLLAQARGEPDAGSRHDLRQRL